MRGPAAEVNKAVQIITDYDKRAGQTTNHKKSTFAASTKKVEAEAASFCYDGHSPPLVKQPRVVGDVVTTLATGAAELPN